MQRSAQSTADPAVVSACLTRSQKISSDSQRCVLPADEAVDGVCSEVDVDEQALAAAGLTPPAGRLRRPEHSGVQRVGEVDFDTLWAKLADKHLARPLPSQRVGRGSAMTHNDGEGCSTHSSACVAEVAARDYLLLPGRTAGGRPDKRPADGQLGRLQRQQVIADREAQQHDHDLAWALSLEEQGQHTSKSAAVLHGNDAAANHEDASCAGVGSL